MLARLHQEGRARVACKGNRIFGVLEILDIGYRADFLDRAGALDSWPRDHRGPRGLGLAADNETAALEGEFALGLCDDPIEVGFADGDRFHQGFRLAPAFSARSQTPACGKLSRYAAPPQLRPVGAARGQIVRLARRACAL
jgi:hypothetical protein